MRLNDFTRGIGKVRRLYLVDSYLKGFQAKILRAQMNGKNSIYLLLDETAFHPKGGGQPTDTGVLYGPNFSVAVKKAMLVSEAVVHWGKLLEGKVMGKTIQGKLEWDSRYKYMKRHTAGHLFDHCLSVVTGTAVETINSWLGDPCYVEYGGVCPSIDELKDAETAANQFISKGSEVIIKYVTYEELLKKASNAPNIKRLRKLKKYRMVTIEGCGPIPCAGTHLKNIKELDSFFINKIERYSSSFQIHYDVK